jgi:hypothetical protein
MQQTLPPAVQQDGSIHHQLGADGLLHRLGVDSVHAVSTMEYELATASASAKASAPQMAHPVQPRRLSSGDDRAGRDWTGSPKHLRRLFAWFFYWMYGLLRDADNFR